MNQVSELPRALDTPAEKHLILAYCDKQSPRSGSGGFCDIRPAPRCVRFLAYNMTRFCHGVATSTGRVRRVNEDSYVALPPLYAVADGMGGHGAGDLASRRAIDTLTACSRVGPLSVETVLRTLDDANHAILQHDGAEGMGTTITGMASLETAGG